MSKGHLFGYVIAGWGLPGAMAVLTAHAIAETGFSIITIAAGAALTASIGLVCETERAWQTDQALRSPDRRPGSGLRPSHRRGSRAVTRRISP